MTVVRQRVSSRLLGLGSAVLLAPPTLLRAEESPTTTAALEATDVATGHAFNALLYLPVGFVLAAIWLEYFAQWKKNRDVEPGILFLLFGATGAGLAVIGLALGFSPVGRDNGQISSFAMSLGIATAFTAAAFMLKRKARTLKLFGLEVPAALSGKVNPPRSGGEKLLIIGYRLALVVALVVSVAAVSEMPLSQAKMPSLATAIRGVIHGTPQAPAPVVATTPDPAAPDEKAPPPKPEVSAGPKLADLLDKRTAPAAPAPAAPAAETPAAPAAPAPAPAPSVAATPPPAPPGPMASETVPPAPPMPMASESTPPPAAPTPTVAPTPAPVTPTAPAAPKTVANAPKLPPNFFATKIKPILDSKCTNCHGAQKAKGDLRLDTIEQIRKGAGHPVVVAGDLELSTLYSRLVSPDDEDLMPPRDKGGPLPPNVIAMFKAWIQAGADFGDGAAGAALTVKPGTAGGRLEEEKAKTLQPPDAGVLALLTEGGAKVNSASANGAFIKVDLSHWEKGSVDLQMLLPIAKNIHTLDCGRAKLNDAGLAPIAQMTNLVRLQLNRNPNVTDGGLVHLRGLVDLESLNLYDTAVTDAGLDQLAGLKKLQKLFLFGTKCTAAGAAKIKAAIPTLDVNLGDDLAPPPAPAR